MLRDSEFCSALHREKYGARLGKALHEIAVPVPAPAGAAGFLVHMPLQQGNVASTLCPKQGMRGLRTREQWPLTIDSSMGSEDARAEVVPPGTRWMATSRPEPVARLVRASSALSWQAKPPAPPRQHMYCVGGAGVFACGGARFAASPQAEPVAAFVRTSSAPAVAFAQAGPLAPAFALSLAELFLPRASRFLALPQAEAAMAEVQPVAASLRLLPSLSVAGLALPEIPQFAGEEWRCDSAELFAPRDDDEQVPRLGRPVAGPGPAALESLVAASVAAPIWNAMRVALPPFTMSNRAAGSFDATCAAQGLAPEAGKPGAAAPRLVAPQPIATVAVAAPAPAATHLEQCLPHPDLLPLEFHPQRARGAAASSPEPSFARPSLRAPHFQLRPVLETVEASAVQPKKGRKEAGPGEIVNLPAPSRRLSVAMIAGRIAAAFLLVGFLWFGVANFHGESHPAVGEEVAGDRAALSALPAPASASVPTGGAAVRLAPKGPAGWVRQTLANRASTKLAENFRGLENWDGGTGKAGWTHHPDGYMNTGALALYRPSLKFTDYHMEFFGQIESKSIGWTVRAVDARNYQAMKLTVVEAGTRPFVALVHYTVVDGKPGSRTETPLNLMVHNNRPMEFAVDVHHNRFVTSIDGEEVDTFTDNTLASGGVGFFSEGGERARLYWMKISRNDDWLGHVCAMLAGATGDGTTAGLGRPELPGGAPAPGWPGDRDGTTLAAMWMGLPYLGGKRKSQFLKMRRRETWNT